MKVCKEWYEIISSLPLYMNPFDIDPSESGISGDVRRVIAQEFENTLYDICEDAYKLLVREAYFHLRQHFQQ